MMRRLFAWLRPDPPRVRVLFDGYTQPERRDGETIGAYRVRQIDAAMLRAEVYDMGNEDEERRAA